MSGTERITDTKFNMSCMSFTFVQETRIITKVRENFMEMDDIIFWVGNLGFLKRCFVEICLLAIVIVDDLGWLSSCMLPHAFSVRNSSASGIPFGLCQCMPHTVPCQLRMFSLPDSWTMDWWEFIKCQTSFLDSEQYELRAVPWLCLSHTKSGLFEARAATIRNVYFCRIRFFTT